MFNNKKGDGSGAALLVIIIAVGILLYILFLPPADRAYLLGEGSSSSSDNGDAIANKLDGKILLSEKPGRLDSLKNDEFTHDITSFTLFSSTESGILRELDSVLISRSVFNEKSYDFEFDIVDKDLIDNLLLSFKKNEGSGILSIYLNDKVLSEKFYEKVNPDPIKIPKDYLVHGNNKLTFKVSSPGILFFMTNKYVLEDLRLFADFTDNTALTSKHSFIIDDLEYENLDRSIISFFVDCMDDKLGLININLNGFQIHSSSVDCGSYVKLEINNAYLKKGENILDFKADKGSYLIDQFKIRTYLDEPIYPVYYFEITKEEYELIYDNELGINLTINFVEKSSEYNQVEININNRKVTADVLETYNEKIDIFVQEETNFIKISPMQGTVDIASMHVFYWDIN